MEIRFWAVICMMALTICALLIKIHLLRKAVKEIASAFTARLATDTNTLIDVSSRDPYVCSLADTINTQLRKLREERHRLAQGDAELKNSITNISHDLRTPLTAICGYLDLLDQEEKSDTVERYTRILRNRAEMMMHLTEELFLYSVIVASEESDAKESVVLNHVLEESIAAFYIALRERGLKLNVRIPEHKVYRTLDRSALSRVFSNLLNNAIKYSDGDLEITLTEAGEITFTNTASNLNCVQVGRLFDRFYTVGTAQRSTGLGLAIVKALVGQMDGTISAKYEHNKLSICILLPEINVGGLS